ncbi:MAG: GNAT family N-acetyltransferase [Acidobacteriota bacterium]
MIANRHSSAAPVVTPLAGLQTIEETASEASSVNAAVDEEMSVLLIDDFRLLEDHIKAWDDLAASALEPNVFYESWMLTPALRKFGSEKIRVALIYARDKARPKTNVLCGLFPLEVEPRYKRLPLKALRLWQHTYCSLCTPLVRAGCGPEVLQTFFNWLESERREPSLIEFQSVSADGPFHHALIDALNRRSQLSFVSDLHTRALFRPRADADCYLRAAVSREHRKDVRRKERSLLGLGQIEYSLLDAGEDARAWIEEFLYLESSGWKGKNRSAMASNDASREYFIEIATEAFRRERLMMAALRLDGQAIAMKCNFLSGAGSFAFKIAFDESHARYSPGLLLEIENIRRLHCLPSIEWMDSCARPDHPMINRLWLDRRAIQTTLISSGRAMGDLAISLMPLARWLRRKMKRRTSKSQNRGES